MSYAHAEDVQAEFKSITFDTDTAVTVNAVQDIIAQEEAKINGLISGLYVTPIDRTASPIAFAVIKSISIMASKARIVDILTVKTGKAEVDQGSGGKELYDKVFGDKGIIEQIKARQLILIDAVASGSRFGVRDYNSQNNIQNIFQRDKRQW